MSGTNRLRESTQEIRRFILEDLEAQPESIAKRVSARFHISGTSANRHLKRLADEGILIGSGRTRARSYEWAVLAEGSRTIDLEAAPEEHIVWEEFVKPLVQPFATANVFGLLNYGFTEMLNNAIEHSEGHKILANVTVTGGLIEVSVMDDGVGIFQKIQRDLHLENPKHALLELAKGKLTTDQAKHTGEGIFFSSRMFDRFVIVSGDMAYIRLQEDDWLLERATNPRSAGTLVTMKISPFSGREAREVFRKYEGEEFGFTKTHVPVELARYEGENLISRSQARRLLARFEKFKEVFLDFKGVVSIGQAFADEIFRVYFFEHPEVKIVYAQANPDVDAMIRRALAGRAEIPPGTMGDRG